MRQDNKAGTGRVVVAFALPQRNLHSEAIKTPLKRKVAQTSRGEALRS